MTALLGLDARLRLARLYLVTGARQQQGDLAEFLAAALAGGVDLVQVWEPGLDRDAERAALRVAAHVAARHGAVVGVNGSAVLAGELQADLLHLDPGADRTAARRHLPPAALLGASCLDAAAVSAAARDERLDYFSLGPVFASPTKPDAPPAGLDLVRHAAAVAPVFSMAAKPWFAVGGITAANLDAVLAAGARRVCVVSAITGAADPQAAAEALAGPLRAAWRADPAAARYTFAAAALPGRS